MLGLDLTQFCLRLTGSLDDRYLWQDTFGGEGGLADDGDVARLSS